MSGYLTDQLNVFVRSLICLAVVVLGGIAQADDGKSAEGVDLLSDEGSAYVGDQLEALRVTSSGQISTNKPTHIELRQTEGHDFVLRGEVRLGGLYEELRYPGDYGHGLGFFLREPDNRRRYEANSLWLRNKRRLGGGEEVGGILKLREFEKPPFNQWVSFALKVTGDEIRLRVGDQEGHIEGPLDTDGANRIALAPGSAVRHLFLSIDPDEPDALFERALVVEEEARTAVAEARPHIRWVYLDRGDQPEGSSLRRELLRQAVLLTVREEFGLATRDAALEEPMPENADAGIVLQVQVARPGNSVTLEVTEIGGTERHEWLSATVQQLSPGNEPDWQETLEIVEQWTRQDLVAFLETLGLERRPTQRDPAGVIPDAVADQLGEPDLFAQYELLRRLHRQIREEGESPDRLTALSRAYVDLGQLARFHYTASEFVFYARSLLYAQRLVATHDPQPQSHWARGYAFAMSGLNYAAKADLERAQEPTDAGEAEPPVWVSLMDDFVNHRTSALKARGAGRDGEAARARYLHFLLQERRQAHNNSASIVAAGEHALELLPRSLRITAGITEQEGVSNMHRHAQRGPQILQENLPAILGRINDLPENVHAEARQIAADGWPSRRMPQLRRMLTDLGDPAEDVHEPSLALLGQLVDQTHYHHVFTVGVFLKFMLSVDTDRFVAEALPSVEGHRYGPYIEVFALDPKHQPDRIDAVIERMEFVDVNLSHAKLFSNTHWSWDGQGSHWARTLKNGGRNAHDLSRMLVWFPDAAESWRRRHLGWLLGVSPHSPIAAAARLDLDWDDVQDELPEMIERFGDDAEFLSRLTAGYVRDGRTEEAKPLLERLISLTAARRYYQQLADIYLAEGDEEKWLRTLEQFIAEGKDTGLSHAAIAKDIAERLLVTGRAEEALPYAERAAQTGSAWGMRIASQVHEALGNFGPAERLRRSTALRYDNQRVEWYLWCRRTGEGDRVAAAQLYREEMARQDGEADRLGAGEATRRAVFYLLEEEYDEAFAMFRQTLEIQHDPWPALHLAILADQRDDEPLRNHYLNLVNRMDLANAGQPLEDRPVLIEISRALTPTIRGEADVTHDLLDDLDAQIAELSEQRQANADYLFARLLEMAGEDAAAETRLRRAADPYDLVLYNQTLAHRDLRERGIDPRTANE
ncbi:MAG: hypothetical protein WD294_14750 [Phycisphaeraceae bacterium]